MCHIEIPTYCWQQILLSSIVHVADSSSTSRIYSTILHLLGTTVQTQIGCYNCYYQLHCYHSYFNHHCRLCNCHHQCIYYHHYWYYGNSSLLDVFTRSAVEGLAGIFNVLLVLCQVGVQAHPLVLASKLGCRLHEILCDVEGGTGRQTHPQHGVPATNTTVANYMQLPLNTSLAISQRGKVHATAIRKLSMTRRGA